MIIGPILEWNILLIVDQCEAESIHDNLSFKLSIKQSQKDGELDIFRGMRPGRF